MPELDRATETAKAFVDVVQNFQRTVAETIWPAGAVLHCPKCWRTQTASVGELAKYLAGGWPVCHGETMHIGAAPANSN